MGHCRRTLTIVLTVFLAGWSVPAWARELLVCADPNNLPYSDKAGQGFENRIVAMIAADMGATVAYTWWAQRRGNVRETMSKGLCDLIPGVASGLEMLATTRPYYRSSYVFVSRRDVTPAITSLDDPRLRTLRIGVQLIGDDGSNSPPAHALSRRGIVGNVRGYMVYGDYGTATPAARVVDAVANDDVDVAIVWGPVAGYFAARHGNALTVSAVSPWLDGPRLPMAFDISMGVRKNDPELRRAVEKALSRHREDIRSLLLEYGVPLVSVDLDHDARASDGDLLHASTGSAR